MAAKHKKKTESQINFLDYIPVRNPDFPSGVNENGIVTVTISHTGFFNRVAQRFFGAPAHSRIDLDRYGSFVWGLIDGKLTVFEISVAVGERFGPEAEPLLNRLVKFFEILRLHNFISYIRPDRPEQNPFQ